MNRISEQQFERLVREHHAAVYRSALRVLAEPGAAADVAQDVFVKALRGKLRLAEADRERATLCWQAARLALNARRARRRRRHHEENSMPSIPRDPDPAAQVVERDLAIRLQECVAELPEQLRVPLQLHCQDELTLQSIGSALRLSTSTVHGRVQQALARLGAALKGRGFALRAVAVPDLLRGLPAAPVPAGLEAQLLTGVHASALVAAGATRRVLLALALALGAIGAAVSAMVFGAADPVGDPSAAHGALASVVPGTKREILVERELVIGGPDAVDDRAAPGGAAAATGPEPTAGVDGLVPMQVRIIGSVHDAAAWPVVGATVTAIAAGGLKGFELGLATTDVAGAFAVDIDYESLRPTAIRLSVAEGGVGMLLSDEIAVPRPDAAAPIALVLPKAAGVATERYQWVVSVRDEHGAALPEVPVTVHRGPLPTAGRVGGNREAQATTDAGGNARLRGRSLGRKWLFVDGRPLGRMASFRSVELARAGDHEATVVLPVGGTLLARAGGLDGAPLDYVHVWLEDEAIGITLQGEPAGDGLTRFRGLGDGAYTLHAFGDMHHSGAALRGLRAGSEPVQVRLKRRDDVRDVGNHMAEIHGKVVDAATGEELALGSWDVEAHRALAGDSTSPFDRVVLAGPAQRMASNQKVHGFHQVGLRPGRHALVVGVAGYAPFVHEFDVAGDELHTGIVVALRQGGEVRGRVVDADGKPVQGALLRLLGIGAGADRMLAAQRAFRAGDRTARGSGGMSPCTTGSGEDGAFVLRRVPPGIAFRLVADHRDKGMGVIELGVVQSGEVVTGRVVRLP